MKFRRLTTVDCARLPEHWWDPAAMAAAERAWGWCGLAAISDAEVRGFILLCPAPNVPRSSPQAGGPVVENAAALMFVEVVGKNTFDEPLAAELLRHALAHLLRRGVRALESFGATTTTSCELPPAQWLSEQGFQLIRSDPVRPKYRIDLDRSVGIVARWRAVWKYLNRPAFAPGPPEPATRGRD